MFYTFVPEIFNKNLLAMAKKTTTKKAAPKKKAAAKKKVAKAPVETTIAGLREDAAKHLQATKDCLAELKDQGSLNRQRKTTIYLQDLDAAIRKLNA